MTKNNTESTWYEVSYTAVEDHYINAGSRLAGKGNTVTYTDDSESMAQVRAYSLREQPFAKDVKIFRHHQATTKTVDEIEVGHA